MILRGICDTPERPFAWLYLALRSECPCCTAARFFALGFVVGVAVAAAATLLFQ